MVSGTNSEHTEYERTNGDVLTTWAREHKNGDETHVAVHATGDYYLAIAADVDADGDPVASHLIASTLTPTEAEERAYTWMAENPKGVKSGSGLGGLLG